MNNPYNDHASVLTRRMYEHDVTLSVSEPRRLTNVSDLAHVQVTASDR